MRLPAVYQKEILSHALEGKPNEVCGLIAGKDGALVKLWRTTNNDPNPRVRYNVDPLELLGVLREIDARGWTLASIYHSHPATDAYPSSTDIGLAYYPDAVYIIVSLAREDEPVMRAFRIVDGAAVEEPLEIVGETRSPVPPIAAGAQALETQALEIERRGAHSGGPGESRRGSGLLASVLRRIRRDAEKSDSET